MLQNSLVQQTRHLLKESTFFLLLPLPVTASSLLKESTFFFIITSSCDCFIFIEREHIFYGYLWLLYRYWKKPHFYCYLYLWLLYLIERNHIFIVICTCDCCIFIERNHIFIVICTCDCCILLKETTFFLLSVPVTAVSLLKETTFLLLSVPVTAVSYWKKPHFYCYLYLWLLYVIERNHIFIVICTWFILNLCQRFCKITSTLVSTTKTCMLVILYCKFYLIKL